MALVPGIAKRGNCPERGKHGSSEVWRRAKGVAQLPAELRAPTRRRTRSNPEVVRTNPEPSAQQPGLWRATTVSRACAGRRPKRSNAEHCAQQPAIMRDVTRDESAATRRRAARARNDGRSKPECGALSPGTTSPKHAARSLCLSRSHTACAPRL